MCIRDSIAGVKNKVKGSTVGNTLFDYTLSYLTKTVTYRYTDDEDATHKIRYVYEFDGDAKTVRTYEALDDAFNSYGNIQFRSESEFEHFVLYESGVAVEFPYDILCYDRTIVELDFKAAVAHRAYVHRYRGITERRRGRTVIKHVGSLTAEVFHSTGEFRFPEAEVNAHVEGVGGLPCEVFVAFVDELAV